MGRWAQRKRRGGGGVPQGGPPPLIEAISATANAPTAGSITVLFSAPVTAGDFVASDFHEDSQGIDATGVGQFSADQLEFFAAGWVGTIMAGDDYSYSGAVPGVAPFGGTLI